MTSSCVCVCHVAPRAPLSRESEDQSQGQFKSQQEGMGTSTVNEEGMDDDMNTHKDEEQNHKQKANVWAQERYEGNTYGCPRFSRGRSMRKNAQNETKRCANFTPPSLKSISSPKMMHVDAVRSLVHAAYCTLHTAMDVANMILVRNTAVEYNGRAF